MWCYTSMPITNCIAGRVTIPSQANAGGADGGPVGISITVLTHLIVTRSP